MSAAARTHVSHQLEQFRQPKVESLTNYINSRIQVARTTPNVLRREEGPYLRQFIAVKKEVEDPFTSRDDAEDANKE